LQVFRGTVHDPSGAFIPDAFIDVYGKDREGKQGKVVRLRSDHFGHFEAKLANGDYVVVIYAAGFARQMIHFSVSKTASSGELRVLLSVGSAE
jgi:hypothetical protein